jgi:hypothetical protein
MLCILRRNNYIRCIRCPQSRFPTLWPQIPLRTSDISRGNVFWGEVGDSGGVRLSPLVLRPQAGPLQQPRMADERTLY